MKAFNSFLSLSSHSVVFWDFPSDSCLFKGRGVIHVQKNEVGLR